jgi:universal stress protein A
MTEAVFTCAATLARATGAALHLLHVCEDNQLGATLRNHQPGEALHLLDSYQRQAHQVGLVQVSTTVRTGDAAAEIVAEAVASQADIIILGAHGCTCLTRFLMGSTAESVLRQAPCTSVLIHREATPRSLALTPLAAPLQPAA